MYNILETKKKEFCCDNPIDKSWTFVKIALILVIVFILVISANSFMEYNEMLQENERLVNEIRTTEEHIGELEYRLSLSHNDPNFVIFVAKERLNLVFPEEILFTGPGFGDN